MGKKQDERRNAQDIRQKTRQKMQCTRYKAGNKVRNAIHKIYKGERQGKKCTRYKARDKTRNTIYKIQGKDVR